MMTFISFLQEMGSQNIYPLSSSSSLEALIRPLPPPPGDVPWNLRYDLGCGGFGGLSESSRKLASWGTSLMAEVASLSPGLLLFDFWDYFSFFIDFLIFSLLGLVFLAEALGQLYNLPRPILSSLIEIGRTLWCYEGSMGKTCLDDMLARVLILSKPIELLLIC